MSGWNWGFGNNSNNNNNNSNNNNNTSNWSWNNTSNNNNNNKNNNKSNNNSSWNWNTSSNNNNNNSNNNNSSWSWNSSSNKNNNNNNNNSGWNWNSSTSNSNNNNNKNNNSSWSWDFNNNSGSNNNNNNKNTNNSTWNWNNNSSNNNNNNNNSNSTWNFNTNNNNNNNSWNWNTNNNNNNNNYNILYNANNPMSVINKLLSQYSPNNPSCRFESILYNKVPRNSVGFFSKPACVRAVLWDQFVANNPNPQHLVPVAVRGYDELFERSKICLAGHVSIVKSYQQIGDKLQELKYNIEKKIKDKIFELKQIQINLSYRLLVILKTYILLSVQSQEINNINNGKEVKTEVNVSAVALTGNEKEMRRILNIMMKQTRSLHFVMANVDRGISNHGVLNKMDIARGDGGEEVFVDPNNMKSIFHFLKDQTKIISHLTKTVQKDLDDLDIIKNGIINANKRVML